MLGFKLILGLNYMATPYNSCEKVQKVVRDMNEVGRFDQEFIWQRTIDGQFLAKTIVFMVDPSERARQLRKIKRSQTSQHCNGRPLI